EGLCPLESEAPVVDQARAAECGQSFLRRGRLDSRACESVPKLTLGEVAACQRPARQIERPLPLRHYALEATFTGVSASAAASAFASAFALGFESPSVCASFSRSGSSRAETTWSGPASAWIRARTCWATSGCSRRNAVAFCRPCPSRSSSKLKCEPDFWTILRSSAASSTVPSHEMPVP